MDKLLCETLYKARLYKILFVIMVRFLFFRKTFFKKLSVLVKSFQFDYKARFHKQEILS